MRMDQLVKKRTRTVAHGVEHQHVVVMSKPLYIAAPLARTFFPVATAETVLARLLMGVVAAQIAIMLGKIMFMSHGCFGLYYVCADWLLSVVSKQGVPSRVVGLRFPNAIDGT